MWFQVGDQGIEKKREMDYLSSGIFQQNNGSDSFAQLPPPKNNPQTEYSMSGCSGARAYHHEDGSRTQQAGLGRELPLLLSEVKCMGSSTTRTPTRPTFRFLNLEENKKGLERWEPWGYRATRIPQLPSSACLSRKDLMLFMPKFFHNLGGDVSFRSHPLGLSQWPVQAFFSW